MSEAPTKRPRISPMVIAGVVLVVAAIVAIVAGVALSSRNQSPSAKPPDQVHAGTPQTGGLGSLGAASGSAAGASSGAAAGASGAGGAAAVAGGVVRPTAPVAKGAVVPTLSAPPNATVAYPQVPHGFRGATYVMTIEPFGWGPGGKASGALIVHIDSSTPADAAAKALGKDFTGRNAEMFLMPAAANVVKSGGSYGATVLLRPQGAQSDVAAFLITSAKLK